MSESLAERLKRLANEKAGTVAAKQAGADFQARVNSFINDNVKPEYERLKTLLKEKIDEANPNLGIWAICRSFSLSQTGPFEWETIQEASTSTTPGSIHRQIA